MTYIVNENSAAGVFVTTTIESMGTNRLEGPEGSKRDYN